MSKLSVVMVVISQQVVNGTIQGNDKGGGYWSGGHHYYSYSLYCSRCSWSASGDYIYEDGNHGTLPKSLGSTCGNGITERCSTCGGDGRVDKSINCTHGRSSSHSYCSHGYAYQHG